MNKLVHSDLLSLENYAKNRAQIRSDIMAHKKDRQLQLGEHVRLYFEDRKTIQYQIQEMLRAEKIFEHGGIQEELDTYNPLIPDGRNWKATFMLEYSDSNERQQKVKELIGIESTVWLQVQGHEKLYPIADEDLERENEEKTSTVHFLRFELTDAMVDSVKQAANIEAGVEHTNYTISIGKIANNIRESLAGDLIT